MPKYKVGDEIVWAYYEQYWSENVMIITGVDNTTYTYDYKDKSYVNIHRFHEEIDSYTVPNSKALRVIYEQV